MVNDHRNSIRRLTHDEAALEALRLARELIAKSTSDKWVLTASFARPNSIDPQPVGKRPSRWIVATDLQFTESPDAVVDGHPMILVDLIAGTAAWAEV